ncbi:uncharacterized protein LOC128550020 [Mercenaria mercenaria]|uniref:uncharacterized protein LOC128550020 n=1 Tax=Mercenaria mercenaria TaxID=6596 RepID=UPI00234ED4F8|nr:uncharacterized protein LOC128550020 [Mercenaria mercenaria]
MKLDIKMPIDIYNKEFQNWLKGVFALNTTRDALCKCVVEKLGDYIKDIPKETLEQFFCCLRLNSIMQLKTQKKGKIRWQCEHEKCRELMDSFVKKHADRRILKYQWTLMQAQTDLSQSNLESMDSSDVINQYGGNKLIWKVATLYMFVEKGETTKRYQNLDDLDISKVIKIMRSCEIFIPDGE